MTETILLNTFVVPQGQENEFIEFWKHAVRDMKRQPGLISTALHKSLDDEASYRFVNIAHWESPEAYRKAMEDVAIKENRAHIKFGFHHELYEVVAE